MIMRNHYHLILKVIAGADVHSESTNMIRKHNFHHWQESTNQIFYIAFKTDWAESVFCYQVEDNKLVSATW